MANISKKARTSGDEGRAQGISWWGLVSGPNSILFQPKDIRERLNHARSDPMDKVYSFLEDGALLGDPDATAYARHWRAAQAESFRAMA